MAQQRVPVAGLVEALRRRIDELTPPTEPPERAPFES
jgi:hypothetical protein